MKKFISGLIVGLMLSSTVVFASNQDISAVLTSFNFVVNGQAKTVSTQPIVYKGTSYLPVRDLSAMMGYNVAYDESSRTISLSNQQQNESSTSTTPDILSDLIRVHDLNNYGIDKVIVPDKIGGAYTLIYKNSSIDTMDYVIIDDALYFNKSVLKQLGIN